MHLAMGGLVVAVETDILRLNQWCGSAGEDASVWTQAGGASG
jgi:hypothetical protein